MAHGQARPVLHRAALDVAFANGNISSYDEYLERLKEGYGLQNVKLGHNKAVKVATFLGNKRMVIKEGKEYMVNPEYHIFLSSVPDTHRNC